MRSALTSDHAGFQLKELLLNRLAAEPDLEMVDLGTYAPSPPVDYPDYARQLRTRWSVLRGPLLRGLAAAASAAC